MKDINIIVATHKKYEMPSNEIYLPLHVGAINKSSIGYQKDDVGDNISIKNPKYCELTGLYWGWKNLKNDYIGLVHYRRYFSLANKKYKSKEEKLKNVLTLVDVDKLLNKADIILPKKRNYYIENLYDHYKHTLYVEPLDITGKIIEKKYPEYYSEFRKLQKRKKAHMFNMFIMKKQVLDDYCKWLFDILFELENEIQKLNVEYDLFHSRFYGRISELLLDVYINTRGLKYVEVKVIDIDNISWLKKGISFIKAKFLGKKYEKSF